MAMMRWPREPRGELATEKLALQYDTPHTKKKNEYTNTVRPPVEFQGAQKLLGRAHPSRFKMCCSSAEEAQQPFALRGRPQALTRNRRPCPAAIPARARPSDPVILGRR